MKTARFALLLCFFSFALLVTSCHRVKESTTYNADPKVDYAAQGYVKAFVTNVELDGCKFMLQLEDSDKKLEPDGLQPEFEKDGLKVWVKYEPEDRMSICMAGQTVKVIDIKIR